MSENTVKREDALITSLREDVAKAKAHQHPSREDFFCLNLVAYMGERMPWVLHHIEAVERDLALALKDNANYRATVQRLMSENRVLRSVIASHPGIRQAVEEARAAIASGDTITLEELEADLAQHPDNADRIAERERATAAVVDAASEGLIVLAGLHFGTTWELSPYVKDELARVTPPLLNALTALKAAQQQPQHASAANDDGQS